MSKRKGARKRNRKKRRAPVTLCAGCRTPQDGSPASLLGALAAVLNACEEADIAPRLKHGIVVSREGYVLPLAGDRWTARTLTYDPLSPPEDPAGDGLDD